MANLKLCPICGGTLTRTVATHEERDDKGNLFVYQNIPALLCDDCGEYLLSDSVVEKLERKG